MESGSVWYVLGCCGGVFEEVWEGVGADGWAFWVCVGKVEGLGTVSGVGGVV